MRGNSGYLRWLPSFLASNSNYDNDSSEKVVSGRRNTSSSASSSSSGSRGGCGTSKMMVMLIMVLTLLIQSSHAGPINTRHRRMMREIYSEFDISRNQTDIQPEAGTCFHNGSEVPENTVHCEKKPGCRVIQKTGYCCAEYQCECERNGTIYANGEKLVDSTTPCRVCHCQAGEITCNTVTCYKRNDCEPKFIPGRCCPEYDSCPPLENVKPANEQHSMETPSSSSSSSSSSSNPEPLESPITPSISTIKPEIANTNDNPGFKIKEITKPEEIRITDEKPKPIMFPMNKPNNSLNTLQQLSYNNKIPTTAVKEFEPVNSIESQNQLQNDQPPQQQSGLSLNSAEILTDTVGSNLSTSSASIATTTTISSSAETVNKLEMADANTVNDEDSQKIVRHTGNIPSNDSKNESPESNSNNSDNPSNEDEKHHDIEESPVMESQSGKEVVIVDSNGNSQPIKVFGAEGLQRGDVLADAGIEHSTSSEKDEDRKTVEDLDLAASSSSDDFRVLPYNPKTDRINSDRTTEGLLPSQESSMVFDTVLYTAGPELLPSSLSSDDNMNLTGIVFDTVFHENFNQNEDHMNSSTEDPTRIHVNQQQHPHHIEDYDTTSIEPNPAYPNIDDDLSFPHLHEDAIPPIVEDYPEGSHKGKSAEQADEPQPPAKVEAKMGTEGNEPDSLLPSSSSLSSLLESTIEDLTGTNLTETKEKSTPGRRSPAPGEPLLIPEWERNTTETSSSSSSNHGTDDNGSSEGRLREDASIELDGSGSGSGFSQIKLDPITEGGLKGISIIDDSEEFLKDSPAVAASTIDQIVINDSSNQGHRNSGNADDSLTSTLLVEPMQKALEAMSTLRKNYLPPIF